MAEKILAFAGSLRRESFNGKLVRIAAEGARDSGALVEEIHLRDIPLPLYDADLEREHGLPENAKVFKRLLVDHDAVLIGSPEYNTGMTAVSPAGFSRGANANTTPSDFATASCSGARSSAVVPGGVSITSSRGPLKPGPNPSARRS